MQNKVLVPDCEIERVFKSHKLHPRSNVNRRKEIVRIGCELRCLSEDDIVYIMSDSNSIKNVERYFYSRKTE